MAFFRFVFATMGMRLCACELVEFNRTNISCNDIREHPRGYKFLYKCSTGNEVFGLYNQTVIAHAKPQEGYFYWSRPDDMVISMDKSSIVTTECRNLKIQCLLHNGQHQSETWEEFEVTESSPVTNEVTPPWDLIIGLSLPSVMLIIGTLLCCYWRNAIMSRFERLLQSCCCHRDGGCCVSGSSRCHEDDAGQVSTTGDVATPHDDVRLEVIIIAEPHGSGGNEQDNTNGTVQANGNLKGDPGGTSAVRTMNLSNGCTHGDRGPEGQPLLDQRAAVHSSDMTAEAVALVNKPDFDPDWVSTCSTTQVLTMTWSQTQDEERQEI